MISTLFEVICTQMIIGQNIQLIWSHYKVWACVTRTWTALHTPSNDKADSYMTFQHWAQCIQRIMYMVHTLLCLCCGVELVNFTNFTLHWRHNERDSIWNHQPHDCLLNRLFRRRSKKISKLCIICLCAGNSTGTGEFPTHIGAVAWKIFPFDDVIMIQIYSEGLL